MVKIGRRNRNKEAHEQKREHVENAMQNNVVELSPEKPAETPATTETAPEVVGDQKPVSTGDQKTTRTGKAKRDRNLNPNVIKFKAQPDLPLDSTITILSKENPKSRIAAQRFSYYKDGMTVAEYLEVCKSHGITNKVSMKDVRWDFSKGFINVTAA